jgi:hypothetical protein
VNAVDLATVVGNPRFMSFLYEVQGRRVTRRHNLTHLGLEFYDVILSDVAFDTVIERASMQLRAQALYRRIAELELLLDAPDGDEVGHDPDDGVGPDETE